MRKENRKDRSGYDDFLDTEEKTWGTDDPFFPSPDKESTERSAKKKQKKPFPVAAVLAVVLAAALLGGAAYYLTRHEHTWIEASCTDTKTCEGCGETEGVPLGHDWKDATLHEPQTCGHCDETQGETLTERIFADAEQYAQAGSYRQAIQLLDLAWEKYGFRDFLDTASDYRMEFGNYHGAYVAAGKYNTILIHRDGQITIVGNNAHQELEAASWLDIIAVSAGDEYVAGLRRNGTVVAAGRDKNHEYTGAESWRNVVAISAGDFHLVGLLADGTVVAAPGYDHCDQAEVELLMAGARGARIVAISAGYDHTLALLEDGTVVACGDKQTWQNEENGVCNVSDWRQIAAICSGTEFCAGLRTDGTVVAAGVDWDLSGWTDVESLAAGDYFLLGLKADGTVLYQINEEAYSADRLQALSQVLEWEDIVYIAAGHDQIIGICSDGNVRCAGVNQDGQCSLDGMFVSLDD